MPNDDEWPSDFPPVPRPTSDHPIVLAFPPELKKLIEILRDLGWWPGADVFLVLCGHSFEEEVISSEIEVEANADRISLNSFTSEAWSRAQKQLKEDIERLRAKYVCFRASNEVECSLILEPGVTTVEFYDSDQWKPYEQAKVSTKIRLSYPRSYTAYLVRARARAKVRIVCARRLS